MIYDSDILNEIGSDVVLIPDQHLPAGSMV